MSNTNHPQIVKGIITSLVAEEEHLLADMVDGTHRPPHVTDEQHAESIERTREHIAWMKEKLADEKALAEWWNSIPEDIRQGLLNA